MIVWDLNLRHLRAVLAIADLGTMNAAANTVNLTQPAITQALSGLEEQLGIALFERRHDGMAPTEAAAMLTPRIRAALALIASTHVTMARLRALLALADCGSYVGASALTGLSQPSLHRSVNDLSLALRKRLVERRGKGVFLTESGQVLARAFRLARVELETGLAEIAALKGFETRKITVGAMPLSRARVLPAAITSFLQQCPQVKVSIIEGARADLVDPLRNGAIDLMVGALREPLTEPDLVQRALFEDKPVVLARARHRLAVALPDLAQMADYAWVMPAKGAPLRDSWEKMFADAGLAIPQVPVESGSGITIRQLLMANDFLTLLSPDQVAVELEAGWLTAIAPTPADFSRTIGVTVRGSWSPTQVQQDFLDHLERAAHAPRPPRD